MSGSIWAIWAIWSIPPDRTNNGRITDWACLRTILHQNGIMTDLALDARLHFVGEVGKQLNGYELLIMNVRSYTFPVAYRSAQIFKKVNPTGMVLTGGMHATVALDEMEAIPEFDRICQGPGENIIVDLVKDPHAFPRVIQGVAPNRWPTGR